MRWWNFQVVDKPRLARKVQMQGAPEKRAATVMDDLVSITPRMASDRPPRTGVRKQTL